MIHPKQIQALVVGVELTYVAKRTPAARGLKANGGITIVSWV